jgi:hypothetical protein
MPEGKTKIRVKIRSGRGAQSTSRDRGQGQPPRGYRQVPRKPLRRFPGQALLLGLASIVVVIGGVAWLFFPARDQEAGLSQAVDTHTNRSSPELESARQEQHAQLALRSPSPASPQQGTNEPIAMNGSTANVGHGGGDIGASSMPAAAAAHSSQATTPSSAREHDEAPIAGEVSPGLRSGPSSQNGAGDASVPQGVLEPATPPAPPSPKSETDPDPRPVETQEAQQKNTPGERDAQDAGRSAGRSYSKHVARAQFTNGIEDREPIDRIGPVVYPNGEHIRRLYFFTELKDLEGERVTHRWEHGGKTMAKISFPVRSNRWRVYSSKHLTAAMTGDWQVVVVNSAGEPLQVSHFSYRSEGATAADMD